jgi:peptidoglycan/LPS O-acetylase OafA/YrhL
MRLRALDGWRGLCALIVALFHFPIWGPIQELRLVSHGWLFVDFFFALSGFVIARRYEGRLRNAEASVRYLITRIGRIWPLHVALLVIFVFASAMQGDIGKSEANSVKAIFTNLAMIHAWGLQTKTTWNEASWSISVEFALYLLFLAAAWLPGRTALYAALVAIAFAVLAFVAPLGIGSTVDYAVFRGMAGFFLGCLLAPLPSRPFGTAVELATVGLVLAFVGWSPWTLPAPLIFALTVYVFAGSRGLLHRLLNTGASAKLGEWSYAIYMVHMLFVSGLWVLASHVGLTPSGRFLYGWSPVLALFAAVGYIAGILALAGVVHELGDGPLQERVKAWAKSVQFNVGRARPTTTPAE